ncbi:MAG: zinc-dependent metalloprotease family protein [Crocinitomicaceae bacterium]
MTLFVCGMVASVSAQTKKRLPCIDKKFSIVAHIFKDSLGNNAASEAAINAAIVGVNGYFDSICITFQVCEFQYHDNFTYTKHNSDEEWAEMQTLYHVKNRINIFYVDSIEVPEGAAGYAGLGAINNLNSGGIVIMGSGGVGVHSHEMGHYFGLEHTFMDSQTTELVNGSNSLTTADNIADTPADPYVFPNPMIDYVNGCRFISMLQDANGDYYDPIVGNIMSYYPCRCSFTCQQYLKMAEVASAMPQMW